MRSLIPVVIALALVAGACGDDQGGATTGALGLQGVELAEPTAKPDFTLVDTEGRAFDLRADTEGELTFVYFGYTYCPDICPVHLAQLAEVLERPGMPDATVVFVSVDPGRDTPERIRTWLDSFSEDFVGVTGTDEDLVAAQESAGVVPAQIEGDPDEAAYLVGHAGQLLAYAPDGQGYSIYPFGTRQSELAHDLPLLAEMGAA